MSTPNIRDFESLFYGNGESAKYAVLKAFADAGVNAMDLLALVGSGFPSAVVGREAEPADEEAVTADYELVAGDVGKLAFVFTQAELPTVVLVPDGLGSAGDRLELVANDAGGFEVVADSALLLVPDGFLAEARDQFSTVVLTKTDDGGGEGPEMWLLAGDLAADV